MSLFNYRLRTLRAICYIVTQNLGILSLQECNIKFKCTVYGCHTVTKKIHIKDMSVSCPVSSSYGSMTDTRPWTKNNPIFLYWSASCVPTFCIVKRQLTMYKLKSWCIMTKFINKTVMPALAHSASNSTSQEHLH